MQSIENFHELLQSELKEKNIIYSIDDNIVTYVHYGICFKINYKIINDEFKFKRVKECINGQHLYRKLKHRFNSNYPIEYFFDILIYIINVLPNIFNFCTICGEKLAYLSDRIMICSKELCQTEINQIVNNNCITELYKEDQDVLSLLITTLIAISNHPKRDFVFTPFPKLFIKNSQKLYGEIEKIIPNNWKVNNIENFHKIMKNINNDLDLYNTLGKHLYGLIKFTILSNNTTLKSNHIQIETKKKILLKI